MPLSKPDLSAFLKILELRMFFLFPQQQQFKIISLWCFWEDNKWFRWPLSCFQAIWSTNCWRASLFSDYFLDILLVEETFVCKLQNGLRKIIRELKVPTNSIVSADLHSSFTANLLTIRFQFVKGLNSFFIQNLKKNISL